MAQAANFTDVASDRGRLTLTVEKVSPEQIALRLEGWAKLRDDQRWGTLTYEPALLGTLVYDRSKRAFCRFEMVALGDVEGRPKEASGYRPGRQPLGIAFELVTHPTPAERVPPRGGRYFSLLERYLRPVEVR